MKLPFHIFSISFVALSAQLALANSLPSNTASAPRPLKVIHSFGLGTWVENLNIRPNGNILAGLATAPEIWQVVPSSGATSKVHTFANASTIFAIVETTPDLFYALVGTFNVTDFTTTPGSWRVEELDFNTGRGKPPRVSTLLAIPEAQLVDGMDVLNLDKGLLITGDTVNGNIYVIDTQKRTYSTAFQSAEFEPVPGGLPVGIDGIKVVGDEFYFTNPSAQTFGVFGVDTTTGRNTTAIRTLVSDMVWDDFIARDPRSIYATGISVGILQTTVSADFTAASAPRNASIFTHGPTACRFGRTAADKNKLYVTGNGGAAGYATRNFTFPGFVGVVDLSGSL